VRTTNNPLAARIAARLLCLRHEFDDWWIHRSKSGRWLAIRGNTCIRAVSAPELRERLRQHAQGFINPDGEGA
jgi:hypothetical protein